jgi:large subunit ribosomal protein L18
MYFRSLHHVYACVIDDDAGHTLVSASTRESAVAEGLGSLTNLEAAARVGRVVAERALSAGIASVVFDTSGLQYHGRAAALADAARDAKLEF